MKQIQVTPYHKTIFLSKGLVYTAPESKAFMYPTIFITKVSSAPIKRALSILFLRNSDKYRFAFNGKENDNETYGAGNEQDYGYRIYNNRLGRFLSVDPITKKYPELTPYQFASNRPIDGIDQDGLEHVTYIFIKLPGKDPVLKTTIPHEVPLNNRFGVQIIIVQPNGKVGKSFFPTNAPPPPPTPSVDEFMKSDPTGLGKINTDVGSAPHTAMKVVAGVIPLVSVPNAVKVLATGEDIYETPATTTTDKALAATEVVVNVVIPGSKAVSAPIVASTRAAIATEVVNTAVQGANDLGLLNEFKNSPPS